MRHDDPDTYEVDGPPPLASSLDPAQVIEVLQPMVTGQRMTRIETVAAGRTTAVVPVLEAFSDPHNVSAILRTSEAMGVQRVDVVAGPYGFRASKAVAKGSHRWLDIHMHDTGEAAVTRLQGDGYRVYAAIMEGELTPDDLADRVRDGGRVALVFGNERRGVSEGALDKVDGRFRVPMYGFVESLNVSVAAAITLNTVAKATRRSGEIGPEQRALIARYLMHSVRDAERVLAEHGLG